MEEAGLLTGSEHGIVLLQREEEGGGGESSKSRVTTVHTYRGVFLLSRLLLLPLPRPDYTTYNTIHHI